MFVAYESPPLADVAPGAGRWWVYAVLWIYLLLVAVPAHIVVCRRNECCAGIYTGTGICIGVAVALASLGPAVLVLYHKRRKQITGKE